VTVRGPGIGGRNTEAALAGAHRLAGIDGVAAGYLATDGDDGTSGAAGAIVDGRTLGDTGMKSAVEALAKNDSHTLLDALGATLRTGPTGTNVNDLMIGLIRHDG
jgi:hydroxypyruvate reductase